MMRVVISRSGSESRSIFGLYFLTWIFTALILCKPFVIFKIQHFVPQHHSNWLDLKKFLHKQGCLFADDHFEYNNSVLSWKLNTFCPIFLFISILFALCLHKPYILLFKCNFGSIEWQFGTYCFYVDLETSSKIKLICVPTQYYWSIPFSRVNTNFCNFCSCVCRIYVSEELITHFCNYYHLRFVLPYEY